MFKNLLVLIVFLWCFSVTQVYSQIQAGMREKYGGGVTFDAEQYKIDRMRIKAMQTEVYYSQNEPLVKEFEKPKKTINSLGEIWIDGYCRYRPAGPYASHFNSKMTEKEFCTAIYPKDTILYMDYFKGSGNIDWCSHSENKADKLECEDILKSIAESNEDGITYKQYKLLFDVSSLPSSYEFNRGVFYTIKRVEGSSAANVEITGIYGYTNGSDGTKLTINDNGVINVRAGFENGDPGSLKIKSGKSKYWRTGEWNEVGIIKDDYNTVRILINGMEECRYRTPDLPIATRFYRFSFNMPYEYDKKGIRYNIRSVRVEEYPHNE